MDRPFVAENTKERERLSSLVGNLTDEELRAIRRKANDADVRRWAVYRKGRAGSKSNWHAAYLQAFTSNRRTLKITLIRGKLLCLQINSNMYISLE